MRKILYIIGMVLAVAFLVHACGGGGGGGSSTGTVAYYVTDSVDDDYSVVGVTVNSVQLWHTGSGRQCTVLSGPVAIDIKDLEGVLELVNVTECPAGQYNRVHIEIVESVNLINLAGVPDVCSLTSYRDDQKPQPNVLACSGGVCALNVTGEVNVLAGAGNAAGLDFDLKEFEVEHFGQPDCSVTMKVSPLHAGDMDHRREREGYHDGISGFITSLDTESDTFTMAKWGMTFTVDYSGAMYRGTPQPGIDGLLTFAHEKNLEVKVFADCIECVGGAITASTVFVKVEGAVSDLDTGIHTFTLTNTVKGVSIPVDYTDANAHNKVQGIIAELSWVEAKLFGHNGAAYLAHEVDVEGGS